MGEDPQYPRKNTRIDPELIWLQRLEEQSFAPARDQTLVIQIVFRHYTDWATLADKDGLEKFKYTKIATL